MAEKITITKKSSAFVLRLVISLLYISIGLQGLISRGGSSGIGALYRAFSSDVLIYLVAVIVMLGGLVLLIPLFTNKLSGVFVKAGTIAVLIIWIAVIFFADIAPGFRNFNATDWISWIESLMFHLIVLIATFDVSKKILS
ncbi:MAG: hypothetical protein RBR15_12365 [Sphaerochaeta sp.]|nr:hypothetical protein [Sphaerochaeta sp.]